MSDLKIIEQEQRAWSEKNFGSKFGTGYRPLLGALEELGELAHAHLKQEQGIRIDQDHESAKKDAVGDCCIYLMDYCHGQGFTLEEAIEYAWREVKTRDWKANNIDEK
jgi:NTP pyrophosphatase (non-canonical NTP hydrolase)